MKRNLALTISALLSLVLSSVHITQDTLHATDGMDQSGTMIVLLIMLVYLYGTVELAGRRLGYIIMLLGGIASLYMPFLHSMGPRATRWGFFFVWTMIGMGVAGAFSAILAARELWRAFRTRA